MTPTFRIAAIAGDGIGKEVLPEGLRVIRAAAERFDFELEIREIAWASCDWYAQHGRKLAQVARADYERGPHHPYYELLARSVPELRCGWLDEVDARRAAPVAA